MAEKQKKRKTCQICGMGFVPTSNVQKYCPDCRNRMQKDGTVKDAFVKYRQARKPGAVKTYKIETPEDNMLTLVETPERPALPEEWQEEQKKIELPDWDAFVAQATEILLKYGRGDLVDKTEFLARIREKLGEF